MFSPIPFFNRRVLLVGGGAVLGLLLFFAGYLVYLDQVVVRKFEGQRWKLPSKIYSVPFRLSPGMEVEGAALVSRLTHLGYFRVARPVRQGGEFRQSQDGIEIFLRDFSYPEHPFSGFPVVLVLDRGKTITRIVDLTLAEELPHVDLEPELISGLYEGDWEERTLIRLSEVSPYLIQAVLAGEDRRFFQHPGVDSRGMLRALFENVRRGGIVQGGSTLTQQLVKNFYLTSRRTVGRKLNEIMMALLLERRYSKEAILEAYLNEIYLGQNGVMGIYGVGEGAWFYFGKPQSELSLAESALLAGLIRSPNTLSPYKDPNRSIARRNVLLERLFNNGTITLKEYIRARGEKFVSRRLKERTNNAPYFIDEVRQELAERYPRDLLVSGGLRVFTTLDMEMQRAAEESLSGGVKQIERNYPKLRRPEPEKQLEAALVALEPKSGAIRAMVGGRDYRITQFNRVTQARRQPGSLFKPFVYLTAFAEAERGEKRFTPASLVEDEPLTVSGGGGTDRDWSPRNYDKSYHGRVTFRTALENSLNVATVRVLQEVGIDKVIETAQALGVKSPMKSVPSLALGTSEVSPLELAAAYAVIANEGVAARPHFIEKVVNHSGDTLDEHLPDLPGFAQVVSPQAAYLVSYLLQGVVEHGTAQGVRRLSFFRPLAAKTGTTSDERDAWFIGYTPELLAAVWVGFDDNTPLRLTGAVAALPPWTAFMKRALAGTPASDFTPPPKIVFRRIDPATGLLCSRGIEEAFIEGTEPNDYCAGEVPGFLRILREIF
jgi:penicillin-binding protein 1B